MNGAVLEKGRAILAGISSVGRGYREKVRRKEGRAGRLTTPPPPSRDLFAALTMQVVARFVMDVRMRDTLALRVAEGVGREASWGSVEVGWRDPFL